MDPADWDGMVVYLVRAHMRRLSGWTGLLNLDSAGKHPVCCDNITRALPFSLRLFCPRIAGAAIDSPAAL